MKKGFLNLALASAFAMASGSSSAAVLLTNAGFDSSDGLITFEEVSLSTGTTVTTQYSAFGATFSPNLFMENGVRAGVGGFSSPQNLANFSPTVNPFSVDFNVATNAAGAWWEFDFGNVATFSAWLGATMVDSYVHTEPSCCTSGTFIGFTGVTFDRIEVSITGTQLMIMDNVQFQVPAPAPLALVVLGLAGLALTRRRRIA